MDRQLKRRIVGTALLCSLAVIFLPLLLDSPRYQDDRRGPEIPPYPDTFNREIPPAKPPATVEEIQARLEKDVPAPANRDELPAPPKALDGPWLIQVGSFSTEARALELRDRLRKRFADSAVFVEAVKGKSKTLYRVRIGPELKREAVDKMVARLKSELKLSPLVVRQR